MSKIDLIRKLQTQLNNKENELETKVTELKNEFDTQKYINELLNLARKDPTFLAEYLTIVKDNEKEMCLSLLRKFVPSEEELNQIFQEAKNLYHMKKRKFDLKGVPQYDKSKRVIMHLIRRINQYNLTRNFKYTNITQINELKSYLERVKEVKTYFENGKLIKEIADIDEIEYIIEKSDIAEHEKTDIIYVIIEENNKFYKTRVEEGESNVSETN